MSSPNSDKKYNREAALIEIYNPGESFPKTIKEFKKIDLEIYEEREKTGGQCRQRPFTVAEAAGNSRMPIKPTVTAAMPCLTAAVTLNR